MFPTMGPSITCPAKPAVPNCFTPLRGLLIDIDAVLAKTLKPAILTGLFSKVIMATRGSKS